MEAGWPLRWRRLPSRQVRFPSVRCPSNLSQPYHQHENIQRNDAASAVIWDVRRSHM
jgi:hypothetical protein